MVDSISYLSIMTLILWLIPIIFINRYFKLSINKKIVYSIIRMLIQLTLVGLFLQGVFDLNHVFINIGYLVMMIAVASFSTIRTCQIDLKKYSLPILLSFILPNLILVIFFNAFVIGLDTLWDARFLIPIGGMLLGNSLSGNIIGINQFYKTIKENEKQYFYLLSLSGNRLEALRPYIKEALLASVSPTIASIETIGLVALPGMMTGQILGGSLPLTAIKYQIAIMITIFIARYIGTLLVIIFTASKSFNDYDVLDM